jgi:hypothetical protein
VAWWHFISFWLAMATASGLLYGLLSHWWKRWAPLSVAGALGIPFLREMLFRAVGHTSAMGSAGESALPALAQRARCGALSSACMSAAGTDRIRRPVELALAGQLHLPAGRNSSSDDRGDHFTAQYEAGSARHVGHRTQGKRAAQSIDH